MVSVARISSGLNFNAQPTQNIINDKEKVKSFASSQINLGYATMVAGAVALAGTACKKGIFKYAAPIPAAAICMMLGSNMLASGSIIKKTIDTQYQGLDKNA